MHLFLIACKHEGDICSCLNCMLIFTQLFTLYCRRVIVRVSKRVRCVASSASQWRVWEIIISKCTTLHHPLTSPSGWNTTIRKRSAILPHRVSSYLQILRWCLPVLSRQHKDSCYYSKIKICMFEPRDKCWLCGTPFSPNQCSTYELRKSGGAFIRNAFE
jgi:hypothetical protein